MLNALKTSTTLISSQILVTKSAASAFSLRSRVHAARSYATETVLPSTPSANPTPSAGKDKKSDVPEGPLRPHLGVEVNPNHGLWAFFRKTVGKGGVESYEALEKKDNAVHYSGRGWSAAELRRKSFKDLHTLWYIILRERNLLETQQLEANRLGVVLQLTPIKERTFRCRKTMARIKYIINERRLAYEGAVRIIADGNEDKVLATKQTSQVETAPEEHIDTLEVEEPVVVHRTAAERAAAGLIQPESIQR